MPIFYQHKNTTYWLSIKHHITSTLDMSIMYITPSKCHKDHIGLTYPSSSFKRDFRLSSKSRTASYLNSLLRGWCLKLGSGCYLVTSQNKLAGKCHRIGPRRYIHHVLHPHLSPNNPNNQPNSRLQKWTILQPLVSHPNTNLEMVDFRLHFFKLPFFTDKHVCWWNIICVKPETIPLRKLFEQHPPESVPWLTLASETTTFCRCVGSVTLGSCCGDGVLKFAKHMGKSLGHTLRNSFADYIIIL